MHAFLALVVTAAAASSYGAPPNVRRYDDLILIQAHRHGLDPRLIKAVIAAESGFVPEAVSPAGARGLMQLLPSTAEELGTPGRRLHEPAPNIAAGAAYLRILYGVALRKRGLKNVSLREAPAPVTRDVVAAYNCGPSCLEKGRRWPAETRAYVKKVLRFYRSPVTEMGRPEEDPPVVIGGVLEWTRDSGLERGLSGSYGRAGRRGPPWVALVPADRFRPEEVLAGVGYGRRRRAQRRRGDRRVPADS